MAPRAESISTKRPSFRPLPDFETAPVFTYREAAALARTSYSTIRRRVAEGALATVSLGKQSPRIAGDSLRLYVREGRG